MLRALAHTSLATSSLADRCKLCCIFSATWRGVPTFSCAKVALNMTALSGTPVLSSSAEQSSGVVEDVSHSCRHIWDAGHTGNKCINLVLHLQDASDLHHIRCFGNFLRHASGKLQLSLHCEKPTRDYKSAQEFSCLMRVWINCNAWKTGQG